MITNHYREISDLPAYFKSVSQEATIQPILVCADGIRGGFNLVLEGGEESVTVSEHGRPAWFGGVRDILPILTDAYTRELIADQALVDLTGCF
jgi:hypothetical protein